MLSLLPREIQAEVYQYLPVEYLETWVKQQPEEANRAIRKIVLDQYTLSENEQRLRQLYPDFEIDWLQVLTYLEQQPKPGITNIDYIWDWGVPYTSNFAVEVNDPDDDDLAGALIDHAANAADLDLNSVMLLILMDPMFARSHRSQPYSLVNPIVASSNRTSPETLALYLSAPSAVYGHAESLNVHDVLDNLML